MFSHRQQSGAIVHQTLISSSFSIAHRHKKSELPFVPRICIWRRYPVILPLINGARSNLQVWITITVTQSDTRRVWVQVRKADLLTAAVCLSECYCWMLDVWCLRASVVHHRAWVAATKATSQNTIGHTHLSPRAIAAISLEPYIRGPSTWLCYQEQRCPFMHCRAQLCLFSSADGNQSPLGIITWHVWSLYMVYRGYCSARLLWQADLEYAMQCVKAAFLYTEAMPLIKNKQNGRWRACTHIHGRPDNKFDIISLQGPIVWLFVMSLSSSYCTLWQFYGVCADITTVKHPFTTGFNSHLLKRCNV